MENCTSEELTCCRTKKECHAQKQSTCKPKSFEMQVVKYQCKLQATNCKLQDARSKTCKSKAQSPLCVEMQNAQHEVQPRNSFKCKASKLDGTRQCYKKLSKSAFSSEVRLWAGSQMRKHDQNRMKC